MPKCDVCLQEVLLFTGDPTDLAAVASSTKGKDRKMVITHQELKSIPRLVDKAISNSTLTALDRDTWLLAIEATHGQSNWLLCAECAKLVPAPVAEEAALRFIRFSPSSSNPRSPGQQAVSQPNASGSNGGNPDPLIRVFKDHKEQVRSVAFSPDSRYAVSGGGDLAKADCAIRIWDVESGQVLRALAGHSNAVTCVTFSPDGSRVLSCGQDNTIRLWDVNDGKESHCFTQHSSFVNCVAFSPDGRQFLSGSMDRTVRLWDVESRRELRQWSQDTVFGIAFSPDGRCFLAGGSRDVRYLKVSGKDALWSVEGLVRSVAFTPDGRLALFSKGNEVKLWDTRTGKELRTFELSLDPVNCVAVSPDGRMAISGSMSSVRLWDIATGEEIRRLLTIRGRTAETYGVTFSPDGRYALSGSGDRTIQLWAMPMRQSEETESPNADSSSKRRDRPWWRFWR